MKKLLYAVMLLLGLSMITSCSCTPESLARKDARELNRAIDRGNVNAMDRAERHSDKHLNRYRNNSTKYFRYVDEYKEHTY